MLVQMPLPLSLRCESRRVGRAMIAGALFWVAGASHAQVLGPDFESHYTITDLGSVPGVPASYGGLLFAPGDPSVLLIGGAAATSTAAIFAVVVTREQDGTVQGFDSGPAVNFLAAPGVTGGIDGGLDIGPGAVAFYSTYDDNQIGQIGSSSVGPDRLVDLTPLGVASSTGALRFVPSGYPGGGRLKIVSYSSSRWYDATVSPDGSGTFDIAVSPGFVQLSGGPEGIAYVKAGNSGFTADSVLVCGWDAGVIAAYEVDGNGEPKPETARTFISGLTGAEGAAIDPVTGDFFFSTFGGGDRVLRVSGFLPPPSCEGDISGDGIVDGADLGQLLGQWGRAGSAADLNGDGTVDGADLGVLLGAWGAC